MRPGYDRQPSFVENMPSPRTRALLPPVDPQRFVPTRERPVRAKSRQLEQDAEIGEGRGLAWVEGEGVPVGIDGGIQGLQTVPPVEAVGEAGIGLGKAGRKGDRGPLEGNRAGQVSGGGTEVREVVIGSRE